MLKSSVERENYLAEIANLAYRLASMITEDDGKFTEEYQQIVAHDEREYELALYQEERIQQAREENEILIKQLVKKKNEVESLEKQLQKARQGLRKQDKKKQDLLTYVRKLEQEVANLTKDCNFYKRHCDYLASMVYEDDE